MINGNSNKKVLERFLWIKILFNSIFLDRDKLTFTINFLKEKNRTTHKVLLYMKP